jgi:hypothetical protein
MFEDYVKDVDGKSNALFSFQINESTDVSGLAKLLAIIPFVHKGKIIK